MALTADQSQTNEAGSSQNQLQNFNSKQDLLYLVLQGKCVYLTTKKKKKILSVSFIKDFHIVTCEFKGELI